MVWSSSCSVLADAELSYLAHSESQKNDWVPLIVLEEFHTFIGKKLLALDHRKGSGSYILAPLGLAASQLDIVQSLERSSLSPAAGSGCITDIIPRAYKRCCDIGPRLLSVYCPHWRV